MGNAPSSHILKFDNRDYRGLTDNETYTTFLAHKLGLPVVDTTARKGYSLTRRYDRPANSDGTIRRQHQEDFCQALGFSYNTKYETEGGPTLKACIELLRDISIKPAEDVMNLIRWQILNLLLGNSDGHAKNISILYTENGPELAPFYDIVCTRVYDGISPDLAFSIGGKTDPGHISSNDWNKFAAELEVSPRLIFRMLNESISALESSLSSWSTGFEELYGKRNVQDRINQLIRRQCRRTLTSFK